MARFCDAGAIMEGDDCPFSLLPPSMQDTFLQDVFNYLDLKQKFAVVPLVCRSWRNLVPGSCSSIVATLRTHDRMCQMFSWLAKYSPAMLQELSLETTALGLFQDNCPLLHALRSLKQLRSLSLTSMRDNGNSLFWLNCFFEERLCIYGGLSCLTSLSSLSLIRCSFSSYAQASLCKLTGLQSLTLLELELSNSQPAEEDMVISIAQTLTQLTSLSLSFSGMPLPSASSALTKLSRLQKLSFGNRKLRPQQLQTFGPQMQHISECCVAVAAGEGMLMKQWLSAAGPQLQHLSICSYTALPPTADSSGLSEAEVTQLLAHLASAAPNLQNLELHDITSLAESCSQLGDLAHLTSLKIYGCGLTYPAIGQLSALKSLEELVLGPHPLPTDGSMQDMLGVARLPRLTRLKVWWRASIFMAPVFGQRFIRQEPRTPHALRCVIPNPERCGPVTLHLRSADEVKPGNSGL
jgi:hypothetical protein